MHAIASERSCRTVGMWIDTVPQILLFRLKIGTKGASALQVHETDDSKEPWGEAKDKLFLGLRAVPALAFQHDNFWRGFRGHDADGDLEDLGRNQGAGHRFFHPPLEAFGLKVLLLMQARSILRNWKSGCCPCSPWTRSS